MKKIVLLENIRSKFNVGSVFRTAEFFNFDKVILCGYTKYPPDKEISKTAIGAENVVNWQYYQEASNAIIDLKQLGFKIIAAELTKESISINDYKLKQSEKYCLVLGNEINGVSPAILELSDIKLEIPQKGKIKESLNVEVCFGIIANKMANF